MAMEPIQIVQLGDKGWVVSGSDMLLYPTSPTIDYILNSGRTQFSVLYGEKSYVYDISQLIAFLDQPYLFLAYTQAVYINEKPSWIRVGETAELKAIAYNSDGTSETIGSEAKWYSNNVSILSFTNGNIAKGNDDGVALVTIEYKSLRHSVPILVLNQDEVLFGQTYDRDKEWN